MRLGIHLANFTLPGGPAGAELGMTATVHLAGAPEPGFVLPLSALFRDGDRPAVWVVGPGVGRPRLTPVEVRAYRQESVVVIGGVRPGDLVVSAGVQKLDPGVDVRPWEDRK